MKTVWKVRIVASFLLLALSVSGAESPDVITLPHGADDCSQLEAGVGDSDQPHSVPYTANAARSLRVDLEHDASMIAFPGNVGFDPNYAISLRSTSGENWSLTYAVDKGVIQPSRAFRATVPLPATLAQRVANVWAYAVANARQGSPDCIRLDGKSYAFSANGRHAHAWEPNGVPAQLVEISDTLKIIVLDTKNTGYAPASAKGQLARQLERIESELKVSSQH